MSNYRLDHDTVRTALPDPETASHVTYNPSPADLRCFSAHLETRTEFESPSYVSDQRSRCSDLTANAVDTEFDGGDYDYVESAVKATTAREMVCLDRRVGRHPDHSYVCRYYVPKEYGRIALAWATLFESVDEDVEPDFVTVQIPDSEETAIRILPERGFTAVLGSDYTGEVKKSFLRLFMYRVKQQGGLGLHAGSKRVQIERDGDLATVGQIFLGLSATGKSTLTAHGLWLDEPESATMLQDDVCALLPDGSVVGSEGKGLYVKTIGLDEAEQPAIYNAVTHESAILENVDVAADGTVDFESDTYTSNGRALIHRDQLDSAGADIDLERADQLFFITRNPMMPPVAKLNPEEAAAAFMLGESIETSAGDPSKAGESIRVVGTNPFIIGSEGEEGNRFRDLVRDLDIECFVLNTGHLGPKSKNIGVTESVTILREIARGSVTWTDDGTTEMTIPSDVPGIDIGEYAVEEHVEDYDRKRRDLSVDRRSYLESFETLDEEIRNAVY